MLRRDRGVEGQTSFGDGDEGDSIVDSAVTGVAGLFVAEDTR